MKIVFGHRDHRDRVHEPPRQLTERERQLLHLIAGSSTEHLGLAMLEQASGARVATECASCPTFGLAQPRAATRLMRPTGVPLGGVAPMMLSSGDRGWNSSGTTALPSAPYRIRVMFASSRSAEPGHSTGHKRRRTLARRAERGAVVAPALAEAGRWGCRLGGARWTVNTGVDKRGTDHPRGSQHIALTTERQLAGQRRAHA